MWEHEVNSWDDDEDDLSTNYVERPSFNTSKDMLRKKSQRRDSYASKAKQKKLGKQLGSFCKRRKKRTIW
jgi:hypothetical protein